MEILYSIDVTGLDAKTADDVAKKVEKIVTNYDWKIGTGMEVKKLDGRLEVWSTSLVKPILLRPDYRVEMEDELNRVVPNLTRY
jgi:hypothetical protein